MVLKKRQEYGFNSFHVPFVPRAPRSARRRHLHDKKTEDGQICAFELLAALAGKLLRESKGSSASSNASEMNDQPAIGVDAFKQEQVECTPPKIKCIYQGSSGESDFVPECTLANGDRTCLLKEYPRSEGDSVVEHASVISSSNSSEKASNDVKPAFCESNASADDFPCKVEDGSSVSRREVSVENLLNGNLNINGLESGGLTINNLPSSNDTMGLYKKFPTLVNTDNSVKLPSCEDHVPNASILKLRNDSNLGTGDDDENFSRYHKPRTKPKALRHTSRIEDRRIRKLLTSKYWKVAPKLKDSELSKVDGGMKPLFGKRKICRSHERFQSDILYKRRKFSDRSLVLTSDGGFSSESVSNFMQFENGLAAMSPEENGVSSSGVCRQASFNFKDSHVRFSIKSFRIPELFIKVPETTTVGSLKRTVMETVQAILGGGLRIGLVLHGKKVRDDNRTLLQTGITSKVNLDTLGFTLEPNFAKAPTLCTEDSPVPLSYNTPQIVSRSPAASVLDSGISDALHDLPLLTKSSNNTDINCELASLYTDKPNDETADSRVLVAVPPVTVDALSVVPVSQKPMRSELVQRRTRRPFSVSEVEALVQAVEELGTGRWRDVKLRSFANADHRTYVDLKDKWKTLVHTAKISPQQRRGEPVPQEVLDRVLAAHAYWSQHQAKLHYGKNQAAAPKTPKPLPVEGMFMM